MHRQMNQHQVRELTCQAAARGRSAMGRAIVHDPENPPGFLVRSSTDHVADQTPEWRNASGGDTLAKNFRASHVPCGQIGQSATAFVLKLDAHGFAVSWRQRRM